MKLYMGMIVKNRFSELKRNLYHNSQFFDEVIVVSDSSTPEVNEWLTSEEAKSLRIKAILDFDGYQTIRLRQRYLDATDKSGWLMRLDVDEFLSFDGGYNLRGIISEAERGGVNMISFKAVDIVHNINGSVRVARPDFYCPNLFKLTPGIRYVGTHHEGVDLGIPQVSARVELNYFHIRSEASVFLRGVRNAFATPFTAGGTGDVKAWEDFKSRLARHAITEFWQLEKRLREGTLPEEVVEWALLHRNAENSEYRSLFVVYFILLHPELNPMAGNTDFPEFDEKRLPYTGEMSF